MFERRSALMGSIARLLDLGLTALSFPVAYWIRMRIVTRMVGSGVVQPVIYPFTTYWPVFIEILVIWFLVGHFLRLYRDIELRNRQQLVGDAAKLIILGVVALNAALFFSRADYISRAFILTIAVVDFFMVAAGRLVLLGGSRRLRDKWQRFHYCLIVGLGRNARELASLIEQSEPMGLRLIGFVSPAATSEATITGLKSQYPIFALGDAYGILQNHVVDEVLFAVNNDELERLEALIDRCHKEGIRTRVDLGFFPRTFARVHLENLRHVPLLTLGSTPNNELALFAKRTADLILSALALIVLSPVMLILALLVRLTSPGPILYRQIRCGLNGRRFTLYKFRSMVANADELRSGLDGFNDLEGPSFKMKNDPRCTPLGRSLRKFSLDELPQLWNVLTGDMSFVGPRPPLPQEVELYATWQRRRLRMRPGLTCLWTLEGRNRLSFDRLVQFDLAYIDNWSLWLDLKIFLKTIPHVASGRGAS